MRVKSRIVVFESDDWGTIRMSSKEAFNDFRSRGFPVDHCPYNMYDSIESNDDMESLFSVLLEFKDARQNHPCFTANNIVANPDFKRIEAAGFNKYFFEPFVETLQRYPNRHRVVDYYKVGIQKRVFVPQFHGREHVNTFRWMKALREKDRYVLAAFNHGMFSVHAQRHPLYKMEYMDAFDIESHDQLVELIKNTSEGLELFRRLWGFVPKSAIAPCYIWHSDIEASLLANGVSYLQGNFYQQQPRTTGTFGYDVKYHYTGQRNLYGQTFLVRNVFFEPALDPRKDWVDHALKQIEIAFQWNSPAIIQTHRVNYIGSLTPSNRDKNLRDLNHLLKKIIASWPDVTFMSSDQLGDILTRN
jgi:hypothetical protein